MAQWCRLRIDDVFVKPGASATQNFSTKYRLIIDYYFGVPKGIRTPVTAVKGRAQAASSLSFKGACVIFVS